MLRTGISHPHVLWTDKENYCGVDFSKAVVSPYGMELVRTYGILLSGFSLDNIIYTSDKELEVVLKIPTSLQEEGATFKMICVSVTCWIL